MTDTKRRPQWTPEDYQSYLEAELALGLRKGTPIPQRDTGVPVPKKMRDKASPGESLTALTKRLEREREQELHKQRLAYHDKMYSVHLNIAREHAAKYDELEHRNGGGRG